METTTTDLGVAWMRMEQAVLWHDLNEAIRSAINGQWSMRAAGVAQRIVGAARLIGPTPHGEVPWSLVAGGVYEAVLAAGDVAVDLPDEEEFARLDELMRKHGGTRAALRPRLAATVAAIASPGEREFIRNR